MDIKIRRNVNLKDLTTFRIGGKARYFCEVINKKDLKQAISFAKDKNITVFVLGGGSDILISDNGFNGLVIRYSDSDINFDKNDNSVLVTAGGGCIWDELVEESVKRNYQGIECLSGIPGTVGAAPIQNIGAYGQELKDVFVKLSAFDTKNGEIVELDNKACEFAYRESMFKKPINKGRYVITDITIKLNKNKLPTLTYDSLKQYLSEKGLNNPSIQEVREAVLDLRNQKLVNPNKIGNAGSFFKNPIIEREILDKIKHEYPAVPSFPADSDKFKLFAGWLIEQAGWKGKRYKNVMVSDKNALVITNPEGKAKAIEVKELADHITKDVYKKFNIKLELEVQYIGF